MRETHKVIIILLSTFVSGLGISSFFIAVNWFIEHINSSSFYVALVNSLCYLSVLVFLPYIGSFCDQYPRKKILVLIYSFGILLQLSLCYFVNKSSSFELLIIIICVTSLISIIRSTDQVCRTAYLQGIVSTKYYQMSNQWLEAIRQGITFIGGGITAMLMKSPSLETILYFNIITFAIGLVLILILPQDTVHKKVNTGSLSYLEKLKSGIIILNKLGSSSMWIFIISILPYALVVSLNVTYPAFFNNLSIEHESQFYAVLSIPYGAGALLASYVNKSTCLKFERFFILHSIIFVVALIGGAILQNIYTTYCALFIIAYCHAAIRVQRNTFVMNLVDNFNIAKVLSFFEIVFTVGVVIISFLLGFVCDHLSPKSSWIITSMILLVGVVSMMYINKAKSGEKSLIT